MVFKFKTVALFVVTALAEITGRYRFRKGK